ncbi:MAG: hypothetical protein JWQ11_2932 [Rhizobacter sp.]|nr:hypothetical protein [Rhizobacter sp.]
MQRSGLSLQDSGKRWRDLLTRISLEVAGPLTEAVERINALTTTGRIDRQSLRALKTEVEAARQAGLVGQQIVRFASGHLRQSPERLHLSQIMRSVLSHRSRELQARGIQVDQSFRPVEVQADASLLFSLLNAVIDWAMAHTQSTLALQIESKSATSHAQLICSFRHAGPLEKDVGEEVDASPLDSPSWFLIEQISWTMGLMLDRDDASSVATLSISFPRTLDEESDVRSDRSAEQDFEPSANAKPLAGSHVLVVAAQRELRLQIRSAVRNMGLIVDYVSSVEEAVEFCREGLPHAIVVESSLAVDAFALLRAEIVAEVPDFAFIEIVDESTTFEISSFSSSQMARVGRDAVQTSLPSALLFELSKGL